MSRGEVADLGVSVALGALAGLCVLTLCVLGDGGPLFADAGLHAWSLAHRPGVVLLPARCLTATGTGPVPYALAGLAGVVAARTVRLRLTAAGLAVLCLASGQAVRYGVMTVVARARPPRADWGTHASGWSFPSGHATTAALTAGLLVLAICLREPRGRTLWATAAGCWGALTGLSRVLLGVHWFTDVVGGWLLGTTWLGLWVCGLARWLPDRFPGRLMSARGRLGFTAYAGPADGRESRAAACGDTPAPEDPGWKAGWWVGVSAEQRDRIGRDGSASA